MKNTIIILLISILLFALALGAVMFVQDRAEKKVTVLEQAQAILLKRLEESEKTTQETIVINNDLETQNTSLQKQLGSIDELIRSNYCEIYPQSSIYTIDNTVILCNTPLLQEPYFITIHSLNGEEVVLHSTSTLVTTQKAQREINLDSPLVDNVEYTITLRVDDGDGIFESDVDVAYPEYKKIFKVVNGALIVR